jgi:hypothetical protein
MALLVRSRAWRSAAAAAAAALCVAFLAAHPARASPQPAECGLFRDTSSCGVNGAGCCEGYT